VSDDTVGQCLAKGVKAISIQADLGSMEPIDRIVSETTAGLGPIDILVNNAGIIAYDPLTELSLKDWERVVGVNQTGVFLGMREVIPHMVKQGIGSVVNVASIWGSAAVVGAHAYHATKGAVLNMSKNAAITYATTGVRINSLSPGFIETPLTDSQAPEVNAWVVSMTPMGRAGKPVEIAQGAVFLGSDESSFMTGSELLIDGGYLAQ
jgi:NAD(P)-dependent dehydrogenase (short-subunit alcohol dehydrogenase family)